eukprot:CAMPEP_0183363144 /NCGR_PEP_ID=MMETSP0164_2-20130417/73609_1 /TAXON_ID=221442 /ORGANISM="Coccolithus pelagicus ssp braarudi, Strain PLY182g" /LENGTH=66 /DNA_ID=CAMNT_0025538175 /DNA_START=61 /DNA_END=261 /DNA_ORIENTATION=-
MRDALCAELRKDLAEGPEPILDAEATEVAAGAGFAGGAPNRVATTVLEMRVRAARINLRDRAGNVQ